MPVINPQRQGLNLPAVQAQATEANFQVGTGATDNSAARQAANRGQAMQQFLSDFAGGFQKQLQVEGARAAVQGAMDAQGQVDAMATRDENVSKQNWLLQKTYADGYVSAAASSQLAQYRVDSLQRIKNAVNSGMSDADFNAQEQKATADFQQKMAQYLPDMSKQSAVQALSSLQQTSAANYKEFQNQRAKQAVIAADSALDQNLNSTVTEFQQRMQTGSFGDAQSALKTGMDTILAAQHLNKQQKLDRVKDYLTSVAQGSDNPLVIDGLQQLATQELGVNSVDVNKALFSEFKRAGSQSEGQALFELSDRIQSMQGQSAEQQQATVAGIRSDLIKYGTTGIISPGQQMSMWNEAQKAREQANAKYAFDDALNTGKTVATYAASVGIDMDKARTQISKHFQDTALGNVQMFQYGQRAKEPWAIETAQGRMGKQVASVIATMDSLGADGKISTENQATIATFAQMYGQSSDAGKMAMAEQIPSEYRGIVQRAIAQSPNNASNIIMDDIRRLAQNKASGRYDNVPANPTAKMVDPSGESNWFSFGSTADAQRQEASAAMQDEYKYLYRTNPEAFVGKSPDDINTMLKGNIQARKLEVEVGGKPRFVFLPAGSNLKDFMGGYQGSTEQFTNSLQDTIQTQVNAAVDPSNVERVIVQAATSGAQGRGMTATVVDKKGIFHNISIDTNKVAALAQSQYDAQLAGETAKGEQYRGMQPASFYDHDNGRTVQVNVSGTNSVGVKPSLFADISSNLMQFEGYRQNKGNGSVGFGLHDNSGLPVPNQASVPDAVNMLKTSLEKQYIPNVRGIMKTAGIPQSDEAMKVLVDLNYHGGNGSTSPVADAMQQYREAVKNPLNSGTQFIGTTGAEAGVWLALRKQPAYKEAQPARKKYLEENLSAWMYTQRLDSQQ